MYNFGGFSEIWISGWYAPGVTDTDWPISPPFPTPPHHNRRKIIRLSNLSLKIQFWFTHFPTVVALSISKQEENYQSLQNWYFLCQVIISIRIEINSHPALKIQLLVILEAEAGRYQLSSAYLCYMCYFNESKLGDKSHSLFPQRDTTTTQTQFAFAFVCG